MSFECTYCGESRFANLAQSNCHVSKNHAAYACTCNKRFTTEKGLKNHQDYKKANEKKFTCPCCCRSFSKQRSIFEHQRMKNHWAEGEKERAQTATGKYYCHDKCRRSFKTEEGFRAHIASHGHPDDKHRCYDCFRPFAGADALSQHHKDTNHKARAGNRNEWVNAFYGNKVKVDATEKRDAVRNVSNIMKGIIGHVRNQPGGKMYSPDIRKAGSNAAKTKIGKPNEFDTNIPLAVTGTEEITRGKVDYKYEDIPNTGHGAPAANNMNVDRKIVDLPKGFEQEIPMGRAVVNVDTAKVQDHLVHNGQIVPREVKRDMYTKVNAAIRDLELGDNVHLARDAHGPAITLTVKQPGSHDINVDIVPTHPSFVPVSVYGWPRPDTHRAFTEDQIQDVKNAGLHLVPKGDTTWCISHSKAEKALFETLDRGNGCRKEVLKCMKKMTADATARSPDGYPGITSHILKNQLLWTCENNHEPGYWQKCNIADRLVDGLGDLEYALRVGKLPNYFNTSENVLAGKDRGVMCRLADDVREFKMRVIHIDN